MKFDVFNTYCSLWIAYREKINFYDPLPEYLWRIVLEIFGLLMALYFVLKMQIESGAVSKYFRSYKLCRIQEIRRDLQYCHPRYEVRSFLSAHPLGASFSNDDFHCSHSIIIFFIIFLRRGAPFLNSYACPPLCVCASVCHTFLYGKSLPLVSERYIFTNIF